MLTRKPPGRRRSIDASTSSELAAPKRFPGPKRVAAFERLLRVALDLEYLAEALNEAEATARWYAERSPSASQGFDDELEAAERAISVQPLAWPPFTYGTRRYLLRRYPFSVVYEIEPLRVVIVAVAHARRRPGYWKSRQ